MSRLVDTLLLRRAEEQVAAVKDIFSLSDPRNVDARFCVGCAVRLHATSVTAICPYCKYRARYLRRKAAAV